MVSSSRCTHTNLYICTHICADTTMNTTTTATHTHTLLREQAEIRANYSYTRVQQKLRMGQYILKAMEFKAKCYSNIDILVSFNCQPGTT